MVAPSIELSNQQARRLWLSLQGLLASPHGSSAPHSVLDTVNQLGMVQLDSISNVARAHHHILWSRHPAYREHDYNMLLGTQPSVFEHFSHDAAILPLALLPYWQRQQKRRSEIYKRGTLGKNLGNAAMQRQIMAQIEANGPMCSRDFAQHHTQRADKSVHAWMRPPHKLALDYLWLKGELGVSHRQGFIKYYELTSRLLPQNQSQKRYSSQQQIDHLCSSALHKLGFASAKDIQGFYDACDLAEVRTWLEKPSSKVSQIVIRAHDDKEHLLYAPPSLTDMLKEIPEPASRLRIVNPFDPVVRNRDRLKMLFGMDYRIEIYTPAAKRKYGYYVYPVLEGDKMTARIDVKADRKSDTLDVRAWWLEPGIKHTESRSRRLHSELKRLASLAGVGNVSVIPKPSITDRK